MLLVVTAHGRGETKEKMMGKLIRGVGIAASVAALAFAGPALASGGVNSGGVNSGGGTGGGGGGGGTTTTPSTSCSAITTFSNTTGYYSVWAAIWSKYAVSNTCGYQTYWTMTFTNGTTGAVDFRASGYGGMSGTVDEDWGAFSTTYTVTLTVTDAAGNVLDSQSQQITTKAGKNAIG